MHAPAPAPPALVGRDRELAILRAQLTAARASRGSLVLIGGEAGIGKTTLAEALCREAEEAGALVLIGRCYDLTETPPYGPWVDLFGRYRPVNGDPPLPAAFARRGSIGAVASQATLFQHVLDFLAALAAQRPVVLLLDDAHWMDAASLDLLRVLARSLAPFPLLLLVAYRSDELTHHHPLGQLIPLLVHETSATRLALRPLDEADIRALIAERYRLTDPDADRLVGFVHGRTEGNALFVGEVLRDIEEAGTLRADGEGWRLDDLAASAVPALLRQVIDGRVARLDAESQRLLTVAAVIGHKVPLAVWEAVAGREEAAVLACVERAEEARLLTALPDGARVQFAHALVREAVYERVQPTRRRHLHRAVADALIAMQNPDPDAVAHHLERAGDARAAEWLVRAGERAERADAWLTAAERYGAANRLMEQGGTVGAERGWLLCRLGVIRRFANNQGGLAALDAAGRIATETGDRLLAATVRYYRGIMLSFGGRISDGIAQLREATDAFAALPAEEYARREVNRSIALAIPTAQTAWGTLVCWLGNAGRYDEAVTEAERVTMDAPSAGGADRQMPKGYADAMLGLMGVYAGLGLPEQARQASMRARAGYRADGVHALVGRASLDYLSTTALRYDTEAAAEHEALAAEGFAAYTRAGDVVGDLPARVAFVPLLVLRGEWGEVRPLALAWKEAGNLYTPWAVSVIGPLARAQGDIAVAAQLVQEALPHGPASEPGDSWFREMQAMQRLAAALALDANDLPAALAWLEAHDRWLAWNGSVLGRAEGHLAWAAYHRAAGDDIRAAQRAHQSLVAATRPRQPLALLAAHRLLGELDTEAGRFDDAAAHLDQALALADACAAPYERALTLLALAELHAATRRHTDASALLDTVRAIFVPLDAKPALARADALAARLGGALPSAPVAPDALTTREVEVLRLLAGGSTIKEIAVALFLSARTVERHITTIYRKVGARGRVDATAYALRNGLTAASRNDF
jgi:DNA-binding CsgD family transcriptional regulator